jgi:uncharacterized protein (DUF1778 family)
MTVTTATDQREYTLRVRLTPEEREILKRIAHQKGVDMSGWVRIQIHDAQERYVKARTAIPIAKKNGKGK